MSGKISSRLNEQREQIMKVWEMRATSDLPSAATISQLALRDSLPVYLDHLSKALARDRKMDLKSVAIHDAESTRIGKVHGADRAINGGYPLTEVISEFALLRETIFEVLEVDGPLSQVARDIIFSSIEEAVNDAAVRFTEFHADIRQKFVTTLTHDLRTPITSARINAQMISMRCEQPALCKKSANMIVTSLDRLNNMIHDLLDASRLQAGEIITFQFLDCDLDKIVREVIGELTSIHGDRFVLESPGPIQGYWARDGLRRTVENLVGNAVKYSTPLTPITVSLRKSVAQVELEVHNEGKPIAEKDQEGLFKSFRRAKSAENSSTAGWGVGLTLVKGVVAAQKGSIQVKSAEGLGTSFILTLPFLASSAVAP
jgi:signal transduction histidine kinase